MKLQLKRSSILEATAAKKPTADQMDYGELAVNYNSADPTIFIKDNLNNVIAIAGASSLASSNWDAEPGQPGYILNKPDLNDLAYVPLGSWAVIPFLPLA